MSGRSPAESGTRMLEVRVRPRASVRRLDGPDAQGVWHAWLRSAPVDGRANEELVALLAERFGCRKSAVTIRSGAASRLKLVRIEDG